MRAPPKSGGDAMISHPNRREFGRGAIAAATVVASGAIRVNAQAGSLEVGTLAPKSGFEAQLGQGCQRGFDLAEAMLRDMGTPVELMNADTESQADVARTQAEKLIRDGAHMLIGAFDSGAPRHRPGREQHGIPFVINIGADPADHRARLQIRLPQFPDRRDAGDAAGSRCSTSCSRRPANAQDRGAHARQRYASARPCRRRSSA